MNHTFLSKVKSDDFKQPLFCPSVESSTVPVEMCPSNVDIHRDPSETDDEPSLSALPMTPTPTPSPAPPSATVTCPLCKWSTSRAEVLETHARNCHPAFVVRLCIRCSKSPTKPRQKLREELDRGISNSSLSDYVCRGCSHVFEPRVKLNAKDFDHVIKRTRLCNHSSYLKLVNDCPDSFANLSVTFGVKSSSLEVCFTFILKVFYDLPVISLSPIKR